MDIFFVTIALIGLGLPFEICPVKMAKGWYLDRGQDSLVQFPPRWADQFSRIEVSSSITPTNFGKFKFAALVFI